MIEIIYDLCYSLTMDTNDIIINPIGCKVEIQWQDGEIECFEFVSDSTSSDGTSKLSYNSPFGQSLIGKKQGDTGEVKSYSYKILSVQLSPDQKKYITDPVERCIAVRNLTKLYHFTAVENIASILRYGILSRKVLEERCINYIANDDMRLEHRLSHINCSLEYPNNTLLWKYKSNSNNEFCLFEIDIQILKDRQWAKCCPFNAAKYAGGMILQIKDIEELFYEPRPATLPPNFTTDKQAEVLIYKIIPLKYINRIIFQNDFVANTYRNIIAAYGIKTIVDDKLFDVRQD